MRPRLKVLAVALFAASCAGRAAAQAPNVIQFFMPDGSYPSREIRFTLTRDDGRTEELFSDSKGKYSMAGSLVRAADYTVTVAGDGSTYDTTVATFRLTRTSDVVYLPVFLHARKGAPVPPPRVVDLSADDTKVPEQARAAYGRGMESLGAGRTGDAIRELTRALELHPQYLRALNDLGVLYLKLGRLDEAGDAFGRALKLSPRFELARLNLGTVLGRQGRYAEAERLLETLFKENPSLPGARLAYADALFDAGKPADARKVLRAGLEDEKLDRATRAQLRYKLGRALAREEKYAEAVKELQAAIELEPRAANAQLLLGGALLQLKRDDEAERALLRAYEIGGGDAGSAQLMLGELYTRQRKYEPALRAFEQYLKDVPDAPNAAQIRGVAANLRAALGRK
jgi:Flp pilus assembly protein TadD